MDEKKTARRKHNPTVRLIRKEMKRVEALVKSVEAELHGKHGDDRISDDTNEKINRINVGGGCGTRDC
jgi:hypothetical protein